MRGSNLNDLGLTSIGGWYTESRSWVAYPLRGYFRQRVGCVSPAFSNTFLPRRSQSHGNPKKTLVYQPSSAAIPRCPLTTHSFLTLYFRRRCCLITRELCRRPVFVI